MKANGIPTASFDILLGEHFPGKQDAMNLLTEAGFALVLLTILNAKMDNFWCMIGLVCSSWVTISKGTHCREPWAPLGMTQHQFVADGNALTSRACLLILAISAMGGGWLLEQPSTSCVEWHPRVRLLWRLLPEVGLCALGSNEATPEELAGGTKPAPKTAPKASAKAKPKPKAKGKNATESSEKHDRSPVKPDQPSPNPVPPKRMRGKQPEDQAKEIEELRKANERMNEELAKMREAMMDRRSSSSSKTAYATPPPKLPAPSPDGKKKPPPPEVAEPASAPPPPTEGARLNRLRRLCERKPSGKLLVPESIHQKWKNGGKDREALLDELERADWSKDLFISRITKTLSKTNKLSRRKKRGWFTKEAMSRVLNWSASPGQKYVDRYNPKLKKYYVVYEEGDEELSEDEERLDQMDTEVAENEVEFRRVGTVRVQSDDEGNDSESEKKEYEKFARFTDSLLARSSKLTDLAQCVQNLEAAVETLEQQYEKCELVKLDVSELHTEKDLEPATVKELRKKIDAQIRVTTAAQVGVKPRAEVQQGGNPDIVLRHCARLIANGAGEPQLLASTSLNLPERRAFVTYAWVDVKLIHHVVWQQCPLKTCLSSVPNGSMEAEGARALNIAIAVMYQSGFWIRADKGLRLSRLIFSFLALYATCARVTLVQRKRRFFHHSQVAYDGP
ncbi:unnamed protein product [Durusdinium trenchii]|uniref:Uncharacterized protein n=1 Tax=Durusdinium trenchii TaxID=1381693 RepID=A0ABP0SW55_9DINO